MTWHLKDREFEKKLEEFSGGNFVNSLNREIERENIDSEFVVWVGFGRKLLGDDDKDNCLCFRTDELEEVPEYNPNGWNEFPAVTPPDSRVCQLTVSHSLDEPIKYFAAFYDFRAKTWRVQDSGRQIDTKVLKDGFVTFRAWRD